MTSPTEFLAEPDVVMLDLHAHSGEEVVRALHARLAEDARVVTDSPRFLAEVLERMRFAPVCIADEIALPHARTDSVSRLTLAVGRASEGVRFDAEHPGVRLIFLIGTPKESVSEYLRVVAAISRAMRNPARRAALMAATGETEFRAQLSGAAAAMQ